MTTLAFAAVEQALARTAGENINATPRLLLEQSLIKSLVPKGDAEVELYNDYGSWFYVVPGNATEEDRTIIFDLYVHEGKTSDSMPLDTMLEPGSYHAVCQWTLKGADRRGLNAFGETHDSVHKPLKIVDVHNCKRAMIAAAKSAIHEAYSDAEGALKAMLRKS